MIFKKNTLNKKYNPSINILLKRESTKHVDNFYYLLKKLLKKLFLINLKI